MLRFRTLVSALSLLGAVTPSGATADAPVDPREARIDRLVWEQEYVEPIVLATELLVERHHELGADHPLVASSYDRLGTLYHSAGIYARAEQLLRIALTRRRAAAQSVPEDIAATLNHLGVLMKDVDRETRPQAFALQREALQLLSRTHSEDDLVFAPIYTALGHLYRLDGDRAPAESLLVRGLEVRRKHLGDHHPEVASSMLWLGWFHLRMGELQTAESLLQRSQEIFTQLGMHRQARVPESYRVSIAALEGRIEGAAALTLDVWQHLRRDHPLSPPGLGLRRFTGDGGAKIASLLLLEGRSEEAWEAMQRTSGWGARLFACLADGEDVQGQETLRGLRRRLRLCNQSFQRIEFAAHGEGTLTTETEKALLEVLQAEAAWMAAEQSAMKPCYGPDAFLELSQIQQSLSDDEAIVGWIEARWVVTGARIKDNTWAYVIRKDGPIHWQFLQSASNKDARASWHLSMEQYEESIRRASIWPGRVLADASVETMAEKVYETWMKPIEPFLQGVRRLNVVREAGQDMLPLECLRDASGAWLLDRYLLAYVPSADLCATLRQRSSLQPRSSSGAALVLGDPAFDMRQPTVALPNLSLRQMTEEISNGSLSQKTLRGALSGKQESLALLPRLPYSGWEARAVATAFPGARLFTGVAATETAVDSCVTSQSAHGWRVVHLATHTLLDRAAPERSAIALAGCASPQPLRPSSQADGLLTAREIYLGWDLNVDLVTLSGCQTGSGRTAGNGHIGLAQAFLRAGARSLLVSQWKVDDVATALLMQRFYQNLTGTDAAGVPQQPAMDKAAALTEAKQWLRTLQDDQGNRVFAHPVYWAGFILLGDAR